MRQLFRRIMFLRGCRMSWLEELRRMNEPVIEQREATTKDGKRFRAYLTSGIHHYLDSLVIARIVTIAKNPPIPHKAQI